MQFPFSKFLKPQMTIHWEKHKIIKGYTIIYWVLGIWAPVEFIRKESSSHWALTVHKLKAFKTSCPSHHEHNSSSFSESFITHPCMGPLILLSHSFNPLPREPEIQLLGALWPAELPSYLWTEVSHKEKKGKTSINLNDSASQALSNLLFATDILFEMLPGSSQCNQQLLRLYSEQQFINCTRQNISPFFVVILNTSSPQMPLRTMGILP